MARLIYMAITSLDGYVADEQGKWGWSVPDEEVHEFVNDLERPIGTHLFGRRMYDVMVAWETMEDEEPAIADFAQIWRSSDKVVFSKTLEAVASERTRIEREFDPSKIAKLKRDAQRDISIGGPNLAGQALEARLVDEIHLLVSPVIVGGGNPALPAGVRLDLELVSQRRFGNGVVHLHYFTR